MNIVTRRSPEQESNQRMSWSFIRQWNPFVSAITSIRQRLVHRNPQPGNSHYDAPTLPAIVHVTHHKAGSQWVAEVLKYSVAPERIVLPLPNVEHFTPATLRVGGFYPAVYLGRPRVEAITKAFPHPMRKVLVIRDLRDTLISLYFSLRYSHVEMSLVNYARNRLIQMSEVEGLIYLLGDESAQLSYPGQWTEQYTGRDEADRSTRTWLSHIARIQRTWMESDDRLLIRYEELVADEHRAFQRMIEYCEIDVDPAHLQQVINHNSFSARTGRKAGQEDIMSHQRKGIAGDWRNYFTDQLKSEFKVRFGNLLVETGYEESLNW